MFIRFDLLLLNYSDTQPQQHNMLLVNNRNVKAPNASGKGSIPDISALSISSMSDYHVFDFPGKDLQREQVIDLLDQQGFIPDDLIEQEVDWFYNSLGIDDLFFSRESPELLSNIINSLYASKLDSFAKSNFNSSVKNNIQQNFNIKNKIVLSNNHAIFMESNNICLIKNSENTNDTNENTENNTKYKSSSPPYQLDADIDELFLDDKSSKGSRAVSFWTPESGLKLTFLYESVFNENEISKGKLTSTQLLNGDIDSISDQTMIHVSSPENKKLYGLLIKLVQEREGPVIKTVQSAENNDEIRLLVAFKRFTTKKYYSALTSLFHYYKLNPSKFYLESFKLSENLNDDIIIFSIYLNQSQQTEELLSNDLHLSIKQIEKEASLLYAIPDNSFRKVYEERQFSPQETVYAHVASTFINHFINRLGSDYQALVSQLNPKESDTVVLEIVDNLKRKLRTETFSQQMIIGILEKYHKVVSKLYKNFAEVHYYHDGNELENTLSYKRLEKLEPFQNEQEFQSYFKKFNPKDSQDLLI